MRIGLRATAARPGRPPIFCNEVRRRQEPGRTHPSAIHSSPMQPQSQDPGRATFRRLTFFSVLGGLCPLIPVPFVVGSREALT